MRPTREPTIGIKAVSTPLLTDVSIPLKTAERLLRQRVVAVEITETDVGADECVLTLDNSDLSLWENPLILPNTKLDVSLGYEDALAPATRFKVIETRGWRQLTLRAWGREFDLDRETREKVTYTGRISEAVIEIACRNGLNPRVRTTPGKHRQLVQSKNETDAQFLQRLAKRVGFVWYIEQAPQGDKGRICKQGRKSNNLVFRSRVPDANVVTIAVGEDQRVIGDPEFEIDISNVLARGRIRHDNPLEKTFQAIEEALVVASDRQKDLEDVIAATTPVDRARRFDVESKTIDRFSWGNATIIDPDEKLTYSSTVESLLQAQEELDGLLAEHERQLVKARITLFGDPFVRPKRTAKLLNVGRLLEGIYYIDTIRYRLRPRETFTMELFLRRNALNFTAGRLASVLLGLQTAKGLFQLRLEAERERVAEFAKLARFFQTEAEIEAAAVDGIISTSQYARLTIADPHTGTPIPDP